MTCSLAIVIPAYNEELRIGTTLNALVARFVARRGNCVIYVVDDGSSDKTAQVAATFDGVTVLRMGTRLGKGGAVRTGVLQARGNWVAYVDADCAAGPDALERLLVNASGSDVVIGSRYTKGSTLVAKQPYHRRLNSQLFRWAAKLVTGLPYRDPQCGCKLLRLPIAKELFGRLFTRRFAFDVELLCRARNAGCRIREVPIVWEHKAGSKLTFSDLVLMYRDLGAIAVRLRVERHTSP